jgi:SSS family transporter
MGTGVYIWVFFVIYMAGMLALGYVGTKRTTSEDSYCTARQSYPWWVLGFTLPAIFASGATFMGSAGMTYGMGWPVMWYLLGYPLGGYLGFVVFAKYAVQMNQIKARTIPELLGARFQSEYLRLLMSVVSILLLFYIAAQMVAGGHIFSLLMGIPYQTAVWLTAILVLLYITFGGAHADFLTDSAQGVMMLVVSIFCLILFFVAPGVEGGVAGVNRLLVAQDPNLGWNSLFYPGHVQYGSLFAVIMIFFAHIPFVLQPHFGIRFSGINKLKDLPKALILAAVVGTIFTIGAGLPGMLGRVMLEPLARADMVLPALFNFYFHPALSALLTVVILAAIMSTVDGLLLAVGTIISNDFYRKTIAPRLNHSEERIEHNARWLSRGGVVGVAFIACLMVMNPPPFLTLFIWLGIGGIMACVSGPLMLGAVWNGTTKTGAIVGATFSILLYGALTIFYNWPGMTATGFVMLINIPLTFVVSLVTPKYSTDHLSKFGFKG